MLKGEWGQAVGLVAEATVAGGTVLLPVTRPRLWFLPQMALEARLASAAFAQPLEG